MNFQSPTRSNKRPCVPKIVTNELKFFYGVKCIGEDVVLENFHIMLSKFSKIPQSTVIRLFQKESSYRYVHPNSLVSKKYVFEMSFFIIITKLLETSWKLY